MAQEKCKQSLREKRQPARKNIKKKRSPDAAQTAAPKQRSVKPDVATSSSFLEEEDESTFENMEPLTLDETFLLMGDVNRAAEAVPSASLLENGSLMNGGTIPRRSVGFSSVSSSPLTRQYVQPTMNASLQFFQQSPHASHLSHLPSLQSGHGMILSPEEMFLLHGSSGLDASMVHAMNPSNAVSAQHQFAADLGQSSQLVSVGLQRRANATLMNATVDTIEQFRVDTKSDYTMSPDLTPLPKEAPVQEDVPELLLSVFSLSGRDKITAEQEALEKATFSDTEKAEVLSDMFGEMCTLDTRPGKRTKKNDLDEDSIEFLVRIMREELQRIPADEKQALLVAQEKAHTEEFTDERLVTFLRCEGMNTKVRCSVDFSLSSRRRWPTDTFRHFTLR